MITIRVSTSEDVAYLAPRLCDEDLREILAAGSPSAEASLTSGLEHSDVCLTGTDEDGKALVMFGTFPIPGNTEVGGVWLLASDEVLKHRTDFLRKSRQYMDVFNRKYPVLMNYTDCRNTVHHRWLKWCGFEFGQTVEGKGPEALPFFQITRSRQSHV